MSARDGLFSDEAGVRRCAWCQSSPAYRDYHDREWGFPVDDDTRLFEKLCLEGFQAGLSWLTILNKREAFRRAFAGFDAARVARFGARDVERLLGDAGIVRHRGKIESTINNARRLLELRAEFGSLSAYAWRFEPAARPEAHHAGGAAGARLARRGDGAGEGPEAARLDLRRPDHGVRVHAGDGPGQRSPRRLRRSRRSASRPGGARRGPGMMRLGDLQRRCDHQETS
jgi:DNA-3-methyladenine glycosylase I